MGMGHLITFLSNSLSKFDVDVQSGNILVVMQKANFGALMRLKDACLEISCKHENNCLRISKLHTGRFCKSLNIHTHTNKCSHFHAEAIETEIVNRIFQIPFS